MVSTASTPQKAAFQHTGVSAKMGSQSRTVRKFLKWEKILGTSSTLTSMSPRTSALVRLRPHVNGSSAVSGRRLFQSLAGLLIRNQGNLQIHGKVAAGTLQTPGKADGGNLQTAGETMMMIMRTTR